MWINVYAESERIAMNINNNFNISSFNLLNSLYQGNMALHSNKLSRNMFPMPNNNAPKSGSLLGSEGVSYVNNLRTSSKSLSNVLRELSAPAASNRIVAISSNPSVVSIQHTGKKPSTIHSMSVMVNQIATGQTNEGKKMETAAAFEGNTGVNRFSIEQGGKTTQISVNVQKGDTNEAVQKKMAEAINSSGAGVKATVVTDAETKTSMLKLESIATGSDTKNSFNVTDLSGGLAGLMGAKEVTKEGQDALYSVNGGPERRSQSNTVSIGNGVTAKFNAASEKAATITWGPDTNATKSLVEDMVKNYNNLYSAAAERTNDPRAQNLASRMVNISRTYTSSLSDMGIGFDNSGRMTIDSKKMDQVAESGKLDQFFREFSGKNYGFTNQLSRLADSISRNPGNFVSSSQFGAELMGNSGYTGFGLPTLFNFFSPGSLMDFML